MCNVLPDLPDPWAIACEQRIRVGQIDMDGLDTTVDEVVSILGELGICRDPSECRSSIKARLEDRFAIPDQCLGGFPLEEQGVRIVFLKQRLQGTLKRWVLAHEIGHLVLGFYDEDGDLHYCTEDAADEYAAELLMPEVLVKNAVAVAGSDLEVLCRCLDMPIAPERILAAIQRRLLELGFTSDDALEGREN